MRIEAEGAAAVAVNTDLMLDNPQARRPWGRTINGAALVGSAAIGDCRVDVFVEDTRVLTLRNSTANQAPNRDDMIVQRIPVPPGALIRALVINTFVTNAGRLILDTIP